MIREVALWLLLLLLLFCAANVKMLIPVFSQNKRKHTKITKRIINSNLFLASAYFCRVFLLSAVKLMFFVQEIQKQTDSNLLLSSCEANHLFAIDVVK